MGLSDQQIQNILSDPDLEKYRALFDSPKELVAVLKSTLLHQADFTYLFASSFEAEVETVLEFTEDFGIASTAMDLCINASPEIFLSKLNEFRFAKSDQTNAVIKASLLKILQIIDNIEIDDFVYNHEWISNNWAGEPYYLGDGIHYGITRKVGATQLLLEGSISGAYNKNNPPSNEILEHTKDLLIDFTRRSIKKFRNSLDSASKLKIYKADYTPTQWKYLSKLLFDSGLASLLEQGQNLNLDDIFCYSKTYGLLATTISLNKLLIPDVFKLLQTSKISITAFLPDLQIIARDADKALQLSFENEISERTEILEKLIAEKEKISEDQAGDLISKIDAHLLAIKSLQEKIHDKEIHLKWLAVLRAGDFNNVEILIAWLTGPLKTLKSHIDINRQDEDGCTLLYYAAKYNNKPLIQFLNRHQAMDDIPGKDLNTPKKFIANHQEKFLDLQKRLFELPHLNVSEIGPAFAANREEYEKHYEIDTLKLDLKALREQLSIAMLLSGTITLPQIKACYAMFTSMGEFQDDYSRNEKILKTRICNFFNERFAATERSWTRQNLQRVCEKLGLGSTFNHALKMHLERLNKGLKTSIKLYVETSGRKEILSPQLLLEEYQRVGEVATYTKQLQDHFITLKNSFLDALAPEQQALLKKEFLDFIDRFTISDDAFIEANQSFVSYVEQWSEYQHNRNVWNSTFVDGARIGLNFANSYVAVDFHKNLLLGIPEPSDDGCIYISTLNDRMLHHIFSAISEEQQARVQPLIDYCELLINESNWKDFFSGDRTKINKLQLGLKLIGLILNQKAIYENLTLLERTRLDEPGFFGSNRLKDAFVKVQAESMLSQQASQQSLTA